MDVIQDYWEVYLHSIVGAISQEALRELIDDSRVCECVFAPSFGGLLSAAKDKSELEYLIVVFIYWYFFLLV